MATSKRLGRVGWLSGLLLSPSLLIILLVYIGCTLWSVSISFTSAKALPGGVFVGFDQYVRLFNTERWQISTLNLLIFGVGMLVVCLSLGFLLAVFLDQKIKGEDFFRTIFLYPFAMSFIVTGIAWQWFLNPELGLQHVVRLMGWESFTFDWIINPDKVMFTILIAGIWQASGLVMAIVLAGLRGIDEDIWKASRIDGIPAWRMYLQVVLPMVLPMLATAGVLLSISVIKSFDLVVAMTSGGPGLSSEVPAKFIMDNLFLRANIGLATAASTVMLVTVIAIVVPMLIAQARHAQRSSA